MTKRVTRRNDYTPDISNYTDYFLKKVDAEQRLRLTKTFTVFVKSENGGFFISGGSDVAVSFGNENFVSVLIAASIKESEEALGILREANARIRSLFTEDDFYAMLATDPLSDYLKEVLEDLKIPVALATEFMAFDVISNKLIRVLYSGDLKLDDLNDTNENYFFVGLYNKKTENLIKKELERYKLREIISKPNSDKKFEELSKIILALKKKLKLKAMNLVF